jgi:hypothetical protein
VISRGAARVRMVAVLVGILAGCGRSEIRIQPAAEKPQGPVVAKVGTVEIHQGQVEALAALDTELREALGLQAPAAAPLAFEAQLERAIELEALSQAAQQQGLTAAALTEDTRRLLAREYLDRLAEAVQDAPVSDDELRAAHTAAIAEYFSSGESALFVPSRLSYAVITIGQVPDLHVPQKGEVSVIAREQAERLLAEVVAACGARVTDLDDFLALGRGFMRGHPTLRLQEFDQVLIDERLATMDPALRGALARLTQNGEVSGPILGEGWVGVVRRGIFSQGLGEDWQRNREALGAKVLQDRRAAVFGEVMAQLRRRYDVQVWPERLAGAGEPKASPRQ